MVRNLILYVLTAAVIAFASPAFAGTPDCEDCTFFKRGANSATVPTTDYDCVWFVQPHQGKVTLILALADGTKRPYTKANAGTHDHICPGRTWLQQSTSKSLICNSEDHYNYAQPGMIEQIANKPKMSQAGEACLFGSVLCDQMGYPAYHHDRTGSQSP
jgi:hypothetical protein